MQKKSNKGITLIALVITIIILLILAGLSISALTGSGLFQKAEDATKMSELKQIEELARLSYMERQIDEITEGKAATIAGVISYLKEKGYNIKQITEGAGNITGITLAEDDITMEKSQQKEITYTFVYEEGTTVRYFVEVQEKYYEILYNNMEITVKTEESDLKEIETVKNEITVESKDANIVNATVEENAEKIVLKSGATGGIVEVTITETNSNITKIFNVIVKEPATSFTITPTEVTIMRGNTTKLTATIEPSNATDKIIWSSSDESIATVSEDGTVTGIAVGTAIITARCGEFSEDCTVEVTKKLTSLDYLISTGLTLNDLGIDVRVVAGRSQGKFWYQSVGGYVYSGGLTRIIRHGGSSLETLMRVTFDLKKFEEVVSKASALKGSARVLEDNHGIYLVSYNVYSKLEDVDANNVAESKEFINVSWGYPGTMNTSLKLSVSKEFSINLGNHEYVVFDFKNKNNSPYPDNSSYDTWSGFILENIEFEF